MTAAAPYPELIAELTEMISPPERGRVFIQRAMPGLADCAPSGRARLDALARMLQDVAYEDVEDAGLQDSAVWVLRRCRIRVDRFPRFAERLTLHTFCSGIGRAWAERRTTIDSGGEALVETVSLWVHLDPVSWHPSPFSGPEFDVYGATAGDRRISHRLRHPSTPSDADGSREWTFRATECDVADHVNNAAYWAPLEEELLTSSDPELERVDLEMEFRTPAQPGHKRWLAAGQHRWLIGDDGELHASLLIASGR